MIIGSSVTVHVSPSPSPDSPIDRFVAITERLSSAIIPCLLGVMKGLRAKRVIGHELYDELIKSKQTDTKKAAELVSSLEGILRNDHNLEELLGLICEVLRNQRERQLDQLANQLTPQVCH